MFEKEVEMDGERMKIYLWYIQCQTRKLVTFYFHTMALVLGKHALCNLDFVVR